MIRDMIGLSLQSTILTWNPVFRTRITEIGSCLSWLAIYDCTDLVPNCHDFTRACSDAGLICLDSTLTFPLLWIRLPRLCVLIYCLYYINTIVIIHTAVFQRTNAVSENTVMDTHASSHSHTLCRCCAICFSLDGKRVNIYIWKLSFITEKKPFFLCLDTSSFLFKYYPCAVLVSMYHLSLVLSPYYSLSQNSQSIYSLSLRLPLLLYFVLSLSLQCVSPALHLFLYFPSCAF